MEGRIIHDTRPEPPHICRPPREWSLYDEEFQIHYTGGTVWECGCGLRWVVHETKRELLTFWRRRPTGEFLTTRKWVRQS